MKEATDSLNKWKMPDIDYTDPVQVEQHKEVLMNLAQLSNNFNQEFENFTKSIPDFKAITVEALGSKQAYNQIINTWTKFNTVAALIDDSYKEIGEPITPRATRLIANTKALTRCVLGDYQKMFRGKTFGEYMKETEKTPIFSLAGATMGRLASVASDGLFKTTE